MTDELTFRDFAAAAMSNDLPKAASVLEALLALEPDGAKNAAAHFQAQLAQGPEFMMKAMSMRQVVESKDRATLGALLTQLFGLSGDANERATAAVLERYR